MKYSTITNGILKFIGLFIFGYIFLLTFSHNLTLIQIVSTLITFIIVVWIGHGIYHVHEEDNKKVFLILLIFGGGIRLLWAFFIPTLPVSDFATFHTSAIELSKGIPILTKNWGYTFLLSIGYRLYPSVQTGKIINAFASTFSLFLLYEIGKKINKPSIGLVAVFLFAIFPSEINMVSVLGTEVLGTTSLILVVFFLVKGINSNTDIMQITAILSAGLFYGLSLMIRTSLVFYIPLIVLILLLSRQFGKYTQRIKIFTMFLFGTVIGVSIILISYSVIGKQFSLAPLSSQPSIPFLAGTNIDQLGRWNGADKMLYSSWPVEKRDELSRQEALRRITSDPIRFFMFIPQKFAGLFGGNDYGNYWSLEAIDWGEGNIAGIHATGDQNWGIYGNLKSEILEINAILAQAVYCVIWFLAFFSFTKKNIPQIYLIILGIVIFTLLPHIVIEVQERYHSYIMPLIALQAAFGLSMFSFDELPLRKLTPS